MLLVHVRTRDPRRALHDTRVEQVADAGGRLLAEDRARGRPGADIALDQQRIPLEIRVGRGFDRCGCERDLHPLVVDVAVSRHAHDDEFARAVHMGQREHDVLQRVGRGPLPGRGGVEVGIGMIDERRDRRRVRRIEDDRLAQPVERDRLRRDGRERLDIGGIAAGRAHERVFADRRGVQELLAARPAHQSVVGCHDHVLETEPLEDPLVGITLGRVGGFEPGIRVVERVCVLHRELAATQEPGAGPRLVAVLVLDLVDRQRQVLIRGVQVLHEKSEQLFVRGSEEIVGILAVLETEDAVAVRLPTSGLLIRVAGNERREVHLVGAGLGHLIADDAFDLRLDPQAQRQPREDAGGLAADVPGADEPPMRRDLGISRVFAQGAEEEVRETCDHEGQV